MCYEFFCNTVDESVPILCPECMAEKFHTLTEEDLYEMYCYFADHDDVIEQTKEIFFKAFNRLMQKKRNDEEN